MEILRQISSYATARNLRFLIIGGHAVDAHGSSRRTADIDFLVSIAEREQWIELINCFKYTLGQNDNRFARFHPEQITQWPIDLMFVSEDVFHKLYLDSLALEIDSLAVQVISQSHLVLLKLHALKHYQPHRFDKDYTDLTEILRRNPKLFTIEELKEACFKYANPEIFDRISLDLKLNDETKKKQ